MKKIVVVVGILWYSFGISQSSPGLDTTMFRKIYTEALSSTKSNGYVDHLSNQIGSRLSGSLQEKKAVKWTTQTLTEIGMTTRKQSVTVPKWTRGVTEFAYVESQAGTTTNLPICALIGSVATPVGGLKAEIVMVTSLAQLQALEREKVKDKVVFFNVPMEASYINPFEAYTVQENIYGDGVQEAAKLGAVGVLFRSANLALDDHPHTDVVHYGKLSNDDKIPVAAISTNGADLLEGMVVLDKKTRFFFNMNCKNWKAVGATNVIGEWKGSQYPNTYITIIASLDSWDVGDAAQSNGAALAQALDVVRILKSLAYTPKYSIRIALLADGIRTQKGRKVYLQSVTARNEKQLVHVENASGGFTPRGFSIQTNTTLTSQFQQQLKPLQHYGIDEVSEAYASQGHSKTTVPILKLQTDPQRYFEVCRSSLDVFTTINARELAMGAAAMASMVYSLDQTRTK